MILYGSRYRIECLKSWLIHLLMPLGKPRISIDFLFRFFKNPTEFLWELIYLIDIWIVFKKDCCPLSLVQRPVFLLFIKDIHTSSKKLPCSVSVFMNDGTINFFMSFGFFNGFIFFINCFPSIIGIFKSKIRTSIRWLFRFLITSNPFPAPKNHLHIGQVVYSLREYISKDQVVLCDSNVNKFDSS